MRDESGLLLWATFPLVAIWKESNVRPKRRPFLGVGFDTLIRLAVWAFLAWSVIQGHWSAVFGAAAAVVGLGLVALGLRWYSDRRGWRERWRQS